MKKLGMLVIAVVMAAMTSCTAMPQEAVQLSTSLGQMIATEHTAHVNIVNQYFNVLSANVDKFALGEYKTTLLTNIRKLAKAKDPNFTDLTTAQYDVVVTKVMTLRLEWLHQVEVDRQTILREIADYNDLMQKVNAEVTNVIRSAAGVDTAKNQLIKDLTERFGNQAKAIEDRLLGSNSKIETMLNDAIKKIIGD